MFQTFQICCLDKSTAFLLINCVKRNTNKNLGGRGLNLPAPVDKEQALQQSSTDRLMSITHRITSPQFIGYKVFRSHLIKGNSCWVPVSSDCLTLMILFKIQLHCGCPINQFLPVRINMCVCAHDRTFQIEGKKRNKRCYNN